jgi:hypothetical protein
MGITHLHSLNYTFISRQIKTVKLPHTQFSGMISSRNCHLEPRILNKENVPCRIELTRITTNRSRCSLLFLAHLA